MHSCKSMINCYVSITLSCKITTPVYYQWSITLISILCNYMLCYVTCVFVLQHNCMCSGWPDRLRVTLCWSPNASHLHMLQYTGVRVLSPTFNKTLNMLLSNCVISNIFIPLTTSCCVTFQHSSCPCVNLKKKKLNVISV